MRKLSQPFLIVLIIAAVGCSTSEPVVVKDAKGTPPSTPMASNPPAAPASNADADKAMADAKTKYEQARASFGKDAKQKAGYVKATDEYAMATMSNDNLSPHDKYTGALRLYREALKADPSDADALKWKSQIEEIYKGMGRPIPQ